MSLRESLHCNINISNKSQCPLSFCCTLNFYLETYLKACISKKWYSNLLLFIEIEINVHSKIKYKYNNVLLYIKFKFIMNYSKCWCLCIQPIFIFILIHYLVWEIFFNKKILKNTQICLWNPSITPSLWVHQEKYYNHICFK